MTPKQRQALNKFRRGHEAVTQHLVRTADALKSAGEAHGRALAALAEGQVALVESNEQLRAVAEANMLMAEALDEMYETLTVEGDPSG
jgi:hypothetical protein